MLKEASEKMVERFLELVSESDLTNQEVVEVTTMFFSKAMSDISDVEEQLVFYRVFKNCGLVDFLEEEFVEDKKNALVLLEEMDKKMSQLDEMQKEFNADKNEKDDKAELEKELNGSQEIIVDCFVEALKALYEEECGEDLDELAEHYTQMKYVNPVKFEQDSEFITEFMTDNLGGNVKVTCLEARRSDIEDSKAVQLLADAISKLEDVDFGVVSNLRKSEVDFLKGLIRGGKECCEKLELTLDALTSREVH